MLYLNLELAYWH